MKMSLWSPQLLPIFFIILFSLLFSLPSSISGFQYGRCFQKLERHSIDNSQPLTEIFRTSPLDCLSQCIEHTGNGDQQTEAGLCRSVIYDHLQHSCRLYGHDGRRVPAIVHPANGFDLYRRTASTQECAGPVQRLLALKSTKKNLLAAPNQANPEGQGPIGLPSDKEGELPLGDRELASLLEQLEHGEQPQSDVGKGEADEESNDRRRAAALDCVGQGRPTAFLAFAGGQRVPEEDERSDEEFLGWNQRQCAQFCVENEGPDGQRQTCAGYSYTPGGGRCRLHRRLAEEELSLQTSAAGAVYAEKWCIPPTHRNGICRESSQFKIHLQQRFNPNCVPIATIDGVQTLVECMQNCLDKFGCQSISFHAPSLQCLLHRENPYPNFVEPADQGWTLAENGCNKSNGPVGLVDSEDGQMDKNVNADGETAKSFVQQQQSPLPPPIDKDCAEGEGRLSDIFLKAKMRSK